MTYLLLLCLFFSVRFLNMCKPTTSTHAGCLTCIRIYGSELTHLPSCLRMVNAGWVSSMKWEIFSQMKFIIFQKLSHKIGCIIILSWQLVSYNQLLIQSFLLLSECCFAKKFEARVLNVYGHFSQNAVIIRCNIFSLVLVICLRWYLHLKLSHEFLTFISFNIWR